MRGWGFLLKYMILFNDILTFLELDYRDASLKKLYLVEIASFKWKYRLSGNDYKVAAVSKSYLTVLGIIMQSLKSI